MESERRNAAALAVALARIGALQRQDFCGRQPEQVLAGAVNRVVSHLNRGAEGGFTVRAFLRPFDALLQEVGERADPAEDRWAIGIDFEWTSQLRVAPLVAAIGPEAAGAVLSSLTAHSPVFVARPEELEWITDGWAEADGHRPNPVLIRRSRQAARLAGRIERLVQRGFHVPSAAIPDRVLRRLCEALVRLDARPRWVDNAAWEATREADWPPVRAVVQLVWGDGCPLTHAADEAEFLLEQDGQVPMPQQLWLLDPAEPRTLRGWEAWQGALRRVRAARRIVHAIATISERYSHG